METGEEKEEKLNELLGRYNIDLKKLEKEQKALAKGIVLKDSMDFSKVVKLGGCASVFFQNKIISAIVVVDRDMAVIEEKYFTDKIRFPYIPGFNSYRELPAILSCFQELEEKPEVMFISGPGTAHPVLGLASHFSISTGIPGIGISDSAIEGEVNGEDLLINKKVVGKIVQTKPGSRPLIVSPGSMISVKSAYELTKKFVREPHKMPEPLRMAKTYAKRVMKELYANGSAE
jgi:deoxyribonuclease V